MSDYARALTDGFEAAMKVAGEARSKGFDPETFVEIIPAQDIAGRVEGIVGPKGIAERIRALEQDKLREVLAFEIVNEIIDRRADYGLADAEKAIDQAVRTGVGILTEGVLVAPTEGIAKIRIRKNPDGSDYLSVYFAGPIRSAGGTVAAQAVVLADVARQRLGVKDYRPTDTEVERYVEEVNVYDARAARLQYKPPDDDVRLIVRNCPVCIDGDPTEEFEVSVHKGLARVETDRVRGGISLVVCEGIAQKASKVLKYTKRIGLNWSWLESLVKVAKREGKKEVKPDDRFLDDIVAGRPIFAYPSAKGGFRLRYGRTRMTGIAAKAIHPATMVLLDNFPAIGTQLRVERPGKGCVVTPCDSIEGPVVKLANGSVVRVSSIEEANKLRPSVVKILFLGDLLVTYGDFRKSNHPLVPSGYCEEYWLKELEKAAKAANTGMPKVDANAISIEDSLKLCRELKVPLAPRWTYFWHDVSAEALKELAEWLAKGKLAYDWFRLKDFRVEASPSKSILEELCVPHNVEGKDVVLDAGNAVALLSTMGILSGKSVSLEKFGKMYSPEKPAMQLINELAGFTVREKAPNYVGARMGRPEKAKERLMKPAPHVLFPVGNMGGKVRSIMKAFKSAKERERYEGKGLEIQVARMKCPRCKTISVSYKCATCGERTFPERACSRCGNPTEMDHCPQCKMPTQFFDSRSIDFVSLMESAQARVKELPDDVKGVQGLVSETKRPEILEKGLLRAKHGIFVFRDGTTRFDATDVPLTQFYPDEVGVSVEKLRSIGYETDMDGNELKTGTQLLDLKPQDILVSDRGADYFLRVSRFLDDLLVYVYGMPPFYNAKSRDDLIGQMVVTLSPHTSCGVLGRIIGFTRARVGYAHPYTIAARRRNCFTGEENIPVFDGNNWELMQLKELIEGRMSANAKEVKRDSVGNLVLKANGLQTLALDSRTGKFTPARISALSKHVAQDHMVSLRTKSGRELSVTGEHPLPKWNGSGLEKQAAFEADTMLAPRQIKIPEKDVERIDLLSMNSKDVMVRGVANLVRARCNSLKLAANRLGMNYKTFMDFVYRDSFPQDCLERLKVPIPGNCEVGAKRDAKSLKRFIKLDEDFLFLLGFYAAEGYARKAERLHYQVCFTACKPEIRELVSEKIERVFGQAPHYDGANSLVVSSRIAYDLFTGFLKTGSGAYGKRVPGIVLSLPKKKAAAFLRGYFTGDGSVSAGNTVEVNCTSVSKPLIDGIAFLLLRFGIAHSIARSDRMIDAPLILKFYGKPKRLVSYKLRCFALDAAKFIKEIGFVGEKHKKALSLLGSCRISKSNRKIHGETFEDAVVEKKLHRSNAEWTYNLTVEPHHNLLISNLVANQCDGDEDSAMMLIDALINFSRAFLPAARGGHMDASLVLTTVMDPSEVDDEVHAMEVCRDYPLEFYEAASNFAGAGEVDIERVANRLGKENQDTGLHFTHSTASINDGPIETQYVQFKSMKEKVSKQFELCAKIRAVDLKDAAERVILSHFLPDLYGNLRSFSKQTMRCVDCNSKYRRAPISGKCTRCGGKLVLTVSKGGIEKYLKISQEMVERYGLPEYLKQRLMLLENDIGSIFQDDSSKQFSLEQFM